MSEKIIKITDQNFEELVLKAKKLVIVDFWAEWCGPCKAIAPILDKISGEFSDNVLIGKVNVDEVKEVPVKYGIRSIPTLLFFHNGEIVRQEVGLQSEQALVDNINQIMNKS
ncbi:MAG: thioredoxin [Candidatus Neomarinimicrobiota bacterium]|nr:thioredoxin [Candidatus Neomarinimicrobiota bacterium]|tara:strand:- start:1775 stop:2110 length:336 start_codon:yes stop_codon:yes gene_type:complete